MQVVLASGSPRRRELLETLGYDVTVTPPAVDETPLPGESADALVRRLAAAKAHSITAPTDGLVVAADTVVVFDGEIIGKPTDRDDALSILRRLNGTAHEVVSGYCVLRAPDARTGSVTSTVTFRTCSEREIQSYVATGDCDDKAGAYGIQSLGGALVAAVNGSYSNVVGLPLTEVLASIRALSDGS